MAASIANGNGVNRQHGFTLLELVVVVTVMVVLATLVVPLFQNVLQQAKEAALKDTLFKMRDSIDKYTLDKEEAPQTLEDLVQAKYLREVPVDPITGRNDTWEVELEEQPTSRNGQRGIINVYSGAEGVSSSGKPYREF
ncbi:MAG: prepilin-type N-terminal cleavage/methylation domain-containing protein [Acidobacteriota bacterium]|nr:prepilin-type N-terminal cleavage/methylation domain-containing protein [Blastocatellia bacterium]MDW8411222.1 prepilin-type N-terminal cleavage/methylation domain-containing protein [Acidobacteriota bacterium]